MSVYYLTCTALQNKTLSTILDHSISIWKKHQFKPKTMCADAGKIILSFIHPAKYFIFQLVGITQKDIRRK